MDECNDGKIDLMKRLDESFRQVRRLIHTEWNTYNVHGLGMTHGKMLIILSKSGALKASTLAEQLTITSGGVTGIADRLIDLGYIQRERSDQDRRIVMLSITDEGLKIVDLIEKVRDQLMVKMFNGMSEADMEIGIALFDQMNNNLMPSKDIEQ